MNTKNIRIIEKPDYISYESIQNLLKEAHSSNTNKGLVYATANQSLDKLKEKLNGSTCFVAIDSEQNLLGTGTIQFRNIDYWYYSGEVGLLKLLAVSPKARGLGIMNTIVQKCIHYAKERHIPVVITDSAEQNTAIEHITQKFGFYKVDCCRYKSNNFYSTVYALWLENCPHSSFKTKYMFIYRRLRCRLYYLFKGGRK